MNAASMKIESDEDGFHLIIDGDSPDPAYQASILDYRIENPEALYDQVQAVILPWLMERDEARQTTPTLPHVDARGEFAYPLYDPKHPDFHENFSALHDNREGHKLNLSDELGGL